MARKPQSDPQPGDEVRIDHLIRHVIQRDGERVFVHGLRTHYWMRLDRWQVWCKKSGAVVLTCALTFPHKKSTVKLNTCE